MHDVIVINGHGTKTSNKFLLQGPYLYTADSLDTDYKIIIDQNSSVEKLLLGKKSLKPLLNGRWTPYHNQSIPNVIITPWNKTTELETFASRVLSETLWSDIDDVCEPYLKRDPQAKLIIKYANKYLLYDSHEAAAIFLRIKNNTYHIEKEGVPLFLYAPQVAKVKVLSETSLSEILFNLQKINTVQHVVLLTCNTGKKPKSIYYLHHNASYINLAALTTKAIDIGSIDHLIQGPRLKSAATKEFEMIIKAYLDPQLPMESRWNSFGEFEVKVNEQRYNITKLLENNPDYEQLDFSTHELEQYVNMLANPGLPSERLWGEYSMPSQKDYLQQDTANKFTYLSYAEKLAITIFSNSMGIDKTEVINGEMINLFLRFDGREEAFSDFETPPTSLDARIILVTGTLASYALSKHPPESNHSYHDLVRFEIGSDAVAQRIQDMQENFPKITYQKGFTSTTGKKNFTEIENSLFNLPHYQQVKVIIQRENSFYQLAKSIAGVAVIHSEDEYLFSAGTQLQFYRYEHYQDKEMLWAKPVRTIMGINPYAYSPIEMAARSHAIQLYDHLCQSEFKIIFNATVNTRILLARLEGQLKELIETFAHLSSAQKLWFINEIIQLLERLFVSVETQMDIFEFKKLTDYMSSYLQYYFAVRAGDIKIVKQFLEKISEHEKTDLLIAALERQEVDTVRVFLCAGVELSVFYNLQRNPLNIAISMHDIEMLKLLLDENIQIISENILLALEVAAPDEMLKMLLEYGANPTDGNKNATPIDYAFEMNTLKALELFISVGSYKNHAMKVLLKYLTESTPDIVAEKYVEAILNGSIHLPKFIMDYAQSTLGQKLGVKIDVNKARYNGETAKYETLLYQVVRQNSLAAITLLLSQGAIYQANPDSEETPLRVALYKGNAAAVAALLIPTPYNTKAMQDAKRLLAKAALHRQQNILDIFASVNIKPDPAKVPGFGLFNLKRQENRVVKHNLPTLCLY